MTRRTAVPALTAIAIATSACGSGVQKTSTSAVVARERVVSRPVRFPQRDRRELVPEVRGDVLVLTVRSTEACRVQGGEYVTTEETTEASPGALMWMRVALVALGAAMIVQDVYFRHDESCNHGCEGDAALRWSVPGVITMGVAGGLLIADGARLGTTRTRITVLAPGAMAERDCGESVFRGRLLVEWLGADVDKTPVDTDATGKATLTIPPGALRASVSTRDGVVGVVDLRAAP